MEQSGNWVARRRAVNLWGAALFELGELEAAELAFRRALELGEQERDALLVARAMNNLGQIANVRGRRVDALTLYQLAVPAYGDWGNVRGLAETYHNMAISYRDLNLLDRADECEQRAIEFAREVPIARISRARAHRARRGRAQTRRLGRGPCCRAPRGDGMSGPSAIRRARRKDCAS